MSNEYTPDDIPLNVSETPENDFKVEVVDDTPLEDRGRKPLPKEVVDELEKDTLEEYSDKVKKRLSQMKKVWHDERREKEAAKREREEALRFAQAQADENKRLKQRLGQGEKLFIDEVKKTATNEIDAAKAKLRTAYEAGDVDQIAAAQEEMTDAKLKLKEYERFKPSLQEPEEGVQQPQQTRPAPVDTKAETWKSKNDWFGKDEEMTALALGLHEKLVKSGIDPRSDEYYDRIDATMKKRFSDYFGDEQSTEFEDKPTPRKPANVVAPATRSTAPRQVRLTASQVALAKKLGLTPEQYARELIKLEN
jgi:hypothetical protein